MTMPAAAEPVQLLRLPQVIKLTGLSRDTIYRMVREGRFPQHIKVSERASRWRADEVGNWLERLSSERTQPAQ